MWPFLLPGLSRIGLNDFASQVFNAKDAWENPVPPWSLFFLSILDYPFFLKSAAFSKTERRKRPWIQESQYVFSSAF